MTKSRLHPQFFQTLVPSFNTHLTIPEDFFLEYIEGRHIAGLKSDSSDKTWKVKMSDRRLTSGWEEFAVANDFRIGDVVVVRYEGDMVIHVSNLGPNYSEIQNISPPCNNNDGKNLLKRLHLRTLVDFSSNDGDVDDDDDNDNIELHKNKKVKKSSSEAEVVSSSSSSTPDILCFVALVTATNLRTDTLYLPQHFTSSNGLTRNCRVTVLTDGGERSWALDLKFNESSDTFYISQGWRNFCDENGQKEGGFFMFKLVRNGEILVLSFCPTDLIDDRRQMDCLEASKRESLTTELGNEEEYIVGKSSEDERSTLESSMELGKKKNSPKPRCSPYSSYSPCHKRFVTFTLPPDFVKIERLTLPSLFVKDNGINKPGEIYLFDKNGRKWLTNLLLDKKGTMALRKGWKDFVKANALKTSFMLKLIWEDTTPVLSLCGEESAHDREQEEFSDVEKPSIFVDPNNKDKINKDEDNKENMSIKREKNDMKGRDSIPSSQKQFVTLTITPTSVKNCLLRLPKIFTMRNGINKPVMITLLGKDSRKHQTKLMLDKCRGTMGLGNGWKDFVKENGLKTGDSFTLELIWEDASPVFILCPEDSIPSSQKQFVTLTITPNSFRSCFLRLSKIFTMENGINKPGMITLLGKDGRAHLTKLLLDKRIGTMGLGNGWKDFVKENGLNIGDSFTLMLIWEDENPVLSLCPAECSIDRGTREGCPETNQKKSIPIEPSKEENIKEENSKEGSSSMEWEKNHLRRRYSIPSSQKQFVTLTITPSSVYKNRLILAKQFARDNNMEKPGMIYLLDTNGKKWLTKLQRDKKGTMSLGQEWKKFAEANDLKEGKTFTMELVWEDETPMLSMFGTKSRSSKSNENESISSKLESRDSSSVIKNRFVTLALTPEDVKACKLILPSQFMKANGINKLGKITVLGENKMEWSAYLLSRDGTVALGNGWEGFCEANGVKLGDSFTLEFICEQNTTPVLKFCSMETKYKNVSEEEKEL